MVLAAKRKYKKSKTSDEPAAKVKRKTTFFKCVTELVTIATRLFINVKHANRILSFFVASQEGSPIKKDSRK